VALEWLLAAAFLGRTEPSLGLGLRPVDDGHSNMGFQEEIDADHAELVLVAATSSGLVLALGQASMLLGIQDDLSRLLSECLERFFVGHLQEFDR
jgi:hypothetical protein